LNDATVANEAFQAPIIAINDISRPTNDNDEPPAYDECVNDKAANPQSPQMSYSKPKE
jgi:hypothetical protein